MVVEVRKRCRVMTSPSSGKGWRSEGFRKSDYIEKKKMVVLGRVDNGDYESTSSFTKVSYEGSGRHSRRDLVNYPCV